MLILGLGALWSIGATVVTVLSYALGLLGIFMNFSDVMDILRGLLPGILG